MWLLWSPRERIAARRRALQTWWDAIQEFVWSVEADRLNLLSRVIWRLVRAFTPNRYWSDAERAADRLRMQRMQRNLRRLVVCSWMLFGMALSSYFTWQIAAQVLGDDRGNQTAIQALPSPDAQMPQPTLTIPPLTPSTPPSTPPLGGVQPGPVNPSRYEPVVDQTRRVAAMACSCATPKPTAPGLASPLPSQSQDPPTPEPSPSPSPSVAPTDTSDVPVDTPDLPMDDAESPPPQDDPPAVDSTDPNLDQPAKGHPHGKGGHSKPHKPKVTMQSPTVEVSLSVEPLTQVSAETVAEVETEAPDKTEAD